MRMYLDGCLVIIEIISGAAKASVKYERVIIACDAVSLKVLQHFNHFSHHHLGVGGINLEHWSTGLLASNQQKLSRT